MASFSIRPLRWPLVATGVAAIVVACAEGSTSEVAADDDGGGVTTSGPGSTGTTTTTGTGGTGGATTTSTTTGTGGGGASYPCSEDPCKLTAPQCGCAPGQKCTLSGTSRVCVADGTKNVGDVCSGSQCVAGSICVGYGAAANATFSCKEFCESDADCNGPGGRCVLDLTDGGSNVLANLCSENCDPISTAGCAAGLGCDAFTDSSSQGFTVCRNAGPGTQGASCVGENIDDCAAGYACVTIDSVLQCARYCNVAAPSCPNSGEQCLAFQVPLTIGGIEYGVCYAP